MAAVFAAALWFAPAQASAAKCHFSKKEKIAMVSWVVLIPGAVITGLACKRDLFNERGSKAAGLPAEDRGMTELRLGSAGLRHARSTEARLTAGARVLRE